MTPKRIEWPKEWNQDKGWVNSKTSHLLVTEPRCAQRWYQCLHEQGTSLEERCRLLGAPGPRIPHTVEDCKREIQTYFDANGKRPTQGTSAEWQRWARYLRDRGPSLSQLCDEMGLPALLTLEWTIEECAREIRSYFEANGVRPSQGNSKKWARWHSRLHNQGSSLRQLCDEMRLPTLKNLQRTIEECAREIRSYFEANGKRPSVGASAEWGNWNNWLRSQDTSLSRLCDEMGLPTLLNLGRTIEECTREIRSYFEANGKRPSEETSREWRNTQQFLRLKGFSLPKLCDEMGLPPLYNMERTIEGCQSEVCAYFEANGVRPSVTSSKEWGNWDAWLRRRQGSSFHQLCDEMRLPKAKAA